MPGLSSGNEPGAAVAAGGSDGGSLAAKQSCGFVSDIILNAVEPGVNYSVLLFLNIVFILLLVTLVVLTLVTNFNIHLIIFSILTVGLMIGLNM